MGWITLALSAFVEAGKAFYTVFTRNNAKDMVDAKNAATVQKIEEQAAAQEQAEEKGDQPIEIK